MRRFLGREPRYSREEIQQQAQAAIEARVNQGRPADEEFVPLQRRLDELDSAIVGGRPSGN